MNRYLKLTVLLQALIICLCLAACGSGGDTEKQPSIGDYAGLWEYVDENLWLRIHDDAAWDFVNAEDEVLYSGSVSLNDDGITLSYDDGDTLTLEYSNGQLIDSVNNGVLRRMDKIESKLAYFERNGLEYNAATDNGTYLLENGVCSYVNLGEGFNTADCYWEVKMLSEQAHDGIREIEFDAICYIPNDSIPDFGSEYIANVTCDLYDCYSGMWLTDSAAYGDSERGDNYYVHTVSYRGKSADVEFAYSVDWQYNVGDYAMVMTKSYVAYLPDDYDGLVFAAEAQTDNFKDYEKRKQGDSIYPEARIMDIDLIDTESALFFDLCADWRYKL